LTHFIRLHIDLKKIGEILAVLLRSYRVWTNFTSYLSILRNFWTKYARSASTCKLWTKLVRSSSVLKFNWKGRFEDGKGDSGCRQRGGSEEIRKKGWRGGGRGRGGKGGLNISEEMKGIVIRCKGELGWGDKWGPKSGFNRGGW
jgi:hypothetical protein